LRFPAATQKPRATRHEYSITWTSLQQPFAALYTWTIHHIGEVKWARLDFDKRKNS
jgi:hypothetical protein